MVGQYWLFAAFCLCVTLVMFRLILRERMLLQGSLSFFFVLGLLIFAALFPDVTNALSMAMGFSLTSNFFFAIGIGGLGVVHLTTLAALARYEQRSTTLTQELALLREQVERLSENR